MKKKRALSTSIIIVVFLAGLSLLLYPSVADYWNSFTQSRAIAHYTEQVVSLDNARYDALLEQARSYNRQLPLRSNPFLISDADKAAYEAELNVSDNGVMGYIEIPGIDVSLPVYHGVRDAVLQVAIGHLEWSSLPVGGPDTHTVLSGHRGLPSAKLFTDLDKMEIGDTFLLRVLDEILTYEVDQILVVEPHEVDDLRIVEGQDLCTLVTCTPYGINTHRLLVRGHRVENGRMPVKLRVTADAIRIEPIVMAPLAAVPMLLIFLLVLSLSRPRKRK